MKLSHSCGAVLVLAMGLLLGCSKSPEPANDAPAATADARSGTEKADETYSVASALKGGMLPKTVAPTRYRLDLVIVPEQERFSGRVEIDVELSEASDVIYLHGNQLEVTAAAVKGDDSIAVGYEQLTEFGLAKLSLSKALGAGTATLQIDYSAPFNGSLEGLYKVEEGGESYAFTQFQATSGRLAFPGFDEPRFKVPFDISLTVKADHVAITSAPQADETALDNGMKTVRFETTKPIPTYLVAFAVGAFDVVEWEPVPASDLRSTPVPLRGITVKGKGDQISYALKHTEKTVLGLEQYFGVEYPYRKIDIVAVPDFAAGAMENVGVITYREQLLLLDETASVRQRRSYFMVHAHELAHQWFGNLVTPYWWTDIWLNESFATWMAYEVLHRIYPEEGYKSQLLNNSFNTMDADSLASARQIREPVTDHREIGAAFDGITYRKGGGVLNMFQKFLGEENFQRGIQHYMKKYAWKNTTAEDFIAAIAEANEGAGDIESAFMSFLEQPGIPFLAVTPECSDSGVKVSVSQSRYVPLGSKAETAKRWQVPACMSYRDGDQVKEHCELLSEASTSFSLPSESCPAYVMPNAGGSSYYRWSLPADIWAQLLGDMHTLPDDEQIAIANSFSAAYRSGQLKLDQFLNSVPAMVEKAYWRAVTIVIRDIGDAFDNILEGERAAQTRAALIPVFKARLLAERSRMDDPNAAMLTASLTSFVAFTLEDQALLKELEGLASVMKTDAGLNPALADQNLLLSLFRASLIVDAETWLPLLQKTFSESSNAMLRARALSALAHTDNETAADWSRELLLSDSIKDNEIFYILYRQMDLANQRGKLDSWIQENFDALVARYPSWNKGQVAGLFDVYCSESDRARLQTFLEPRVEPLENGPRTLAHTLERIELCTALRAANM